jgi:hypothetical protein
MQRVIPTGCIINIQNQFAWPEHLTQALQVMKNSSGQNVFVSWVASLKGGSHSDHALRAEIFRLQPVGW